MTTSTTTTSTTTIKILSATEYPCVDCGERECEHLDELAAYCAVTLRLRGELTQVGCMIGVRESDWGSVRASGAGVRPYVTAWWADASDWAGLTDEDAAAVLSAIVDASDRLYRQVRS